MLKSKAVWGIILIVLGFLFMVNNIFNLQLFNIEYLWPFFILLPGLAFELSFFLFKPGPGVLVPGGILTTLGLLFFFETITGWRFSEYTWPIYPLSVAIGLFQLYLFSDKNKGLLIPILILGGISLVSFAVMLLGSLLSWISFSWAFPLLLVLIGIVLLLKK